MTFRHANALDRQTLNHFFSGFSLPPRFVEIVDEGVGGNSVEYIVALAVDSDSIESIAAYGMVAGTLGTGAMYGVVPVSNRVTELLSFAAHDLQKLGAQRIVAEFPDTEEYKPYRDVLLESGYDPTGIVEDFYREGIAMVILTRKLTS